MAGKAHDRVRPREAACRNKDQTDADSKKNRTGALKNETKTKIASALKNSTL